MDVGVTLTRYESTRVDYLWAGGYRVRVVASDPVGMDGYVFLFHRKPVNPHTDTADDVFVGVASPVEMADYPVGSPNGLTPYPYFRLDYFEIDVPSATLVAHVWDGVVNQVDVLVRALKLLDRLSPAAETRVGDSLPSSASSSDSDSA